MKKNAGLIRHICEDTNIDTNDMPGVQHPDELVAYSIICDICDDHYGVTAKDYGLEDAANWEEVKADYQKLIAA